MNLASLFSQAFKPTLFASLTFQAGMDGDPGRLVDDEQVLVLVGDDDGRELIGRDRRLVGDVDLDHLPACEPLAW